MEIIRTILGYATGFTTEIYAELDHDKARVSYPALGETCIGRQ